MTDSFAALVEVATRAWQEAQRENRWSSYDECIRGLFAAVLDARGPCEECEGEGRRFIVGCHGSDEECPACGGSGLGQPVIVGVLVERGVLDGTVEHLVKFDVDGWTLQHPLSERLAGSLFECEWNDRLSALDGPPPEGLGIYTAEWDGRDIAYVPAKRS